MKNFRILLFLLATTIISLGIVVRSFGQNSVAPKLQSIYYISDADKQISAAIPKGSIVVCNVYMGRYVHKDSTRRFLYSDTLITIDKDIPNNVYKNGRFREYYITSDTVTINNTTYVTNYQRKPTIIAGDTTSKAWVQTWKVYVYDSLWVRDTIEVHGKMWLTLKKCPIGTVFSTFAKVSGNVLGIDNDDFSYLNKESWIKLEDEDDQR